GEGRRRRPPHRRRDRGRVRGHRQRYGAHRALPRVPAPRPDARRLEDRERALATHLREPAPKTTPRSAAEEALLDAAERLRVDVDDRYDEVWLELQALAWNRPEMRKRLAPVDAEWRAVLTDAFAMPREELGIDMPLDALVSLVVTFNFGIMVEHLSGITTGHAELLDWID